MLTIKPIKDRRGWRSVTCPCGAWAMDLPRVDVEAAARGHVTAVHDGCRYLLDDEDIRPEVVALSGLFVVSALIVMLPAVMFESWLAMLGAWAALVVAVVIPVVFVAWAVGQRGDAPPSATD